MRPPAQNIRVNTTFIGTKLQGDLALCQSFQGAKPGALQVVKENYLAVRPETEHLTVLRVGKVLEQLGLAGASQGGAEVRLATL